MNDAPTPIETRLAAWTPRATASRDTMLYQAGREAARSDVSLRRLAAVSVLLGATGFALFASERARRLDLEAQQSKGPVARVIITPGQPWQPAPTLDANSYQALLARVRGQGGDESGPTLMPRNVNPGVGSVGPDSSIWTARRALDFDPLPG